MQVGDILDVDIIDVDNNGNGIAKYNNFVVIIPKLLKGENASVKLTKIKKNYANAELVKINSKCKNRIKSICPYYDKCGGCFFLHTTFDNELEIKEKYLKRIFDNYKLNEIVHDDNLYYRNKVVLHVMDKVIGLYEEKTNNIVAIKSCWLLNPKINEIINILNKIDLKDVTEVMIRVSMTTGQTMIRFDNDIDVTLLKQIDSIYIKNENVYGKDYIKEIINDITYTIYPDSFFQVNTNMMVKLYDIIRKYSKNGNYLLDLYCGTGTIGIYLKDNYKKILGVEINKSSIRNAKLNKKINNVNNIEFINGDAKILKEKKYDTIIVDPPRIGLSDDVINNLLKNKCKKIIYVSCNPNTLKRDLLKLETIYNVLEITPVNMFPRTSHIECVVKFELK